MAAFISQTLWTREEAPAALLFQNSGLESFQEWSLFVRHRVPLLMSSLRSKPMLRFSVLAWQELCVALDATSHQTGQASALKSPLNAQPTHSGDSGDSEEGPGHKPHPHRALDLLLDLAQTPSWRDVIILTPPSAALPESSLALIEALKQRNISVCLGSFSLTRPSIAMISHCHGAELSMADLGRDLCSNLSLRLSQSKQWGFISHTHSRMQFMDLAKLGCGPFLGQALFERPISQASQKPDISVRKVLKLLNMTYAEEDLTDIEVEIKQDVTLSYKLISLINSAGLRSQRSVGSAREALLLLGYTQLAHWLSLLLLSSSVSSQKQSALRFSLAKRAKLCENLARHMMDESYNTSLKQSALTPESHSSLSSKKTTSPATYPKHFSDRAFVCGLLSSIDALFDAPLSPLLKEAGLPTDIIDAIEYHQGPLGAILACAQSYERSSALVDENGSKLKEHTALSLSSMELAHDEALRWALSTVPFITL